MVISKPQKVNQDCKILKNHQFFGDRRNFLRIIGIVSQNFINFVPNKTKRQMENRDLNRLKVVLAERKITNKWLAEQLGKDQGTISKWCTNTSQPDLANLMKIAELLNVDLNELVRFENNKQQLNVERNGNNTNY